MEAPPGGAPLEDEMTRFAREMAELEDNGTDAGPAAVPAAVAAPRVLSKTISAAPRRVEPTQPSAAAAPHPPPAAFAPPSYGAPAAPSAQHTYHTQPTLAAPGSVAAIADRRNEELRAATEAASAQARYEHARELATSAQAHLAAAAAAAAAAGAAAASGPKAPVKRGVAGTEWEDPTMADWPENDFRLFVGNLGNDATDLLLMQAFSKYPSFQRARAVRDKRYNKPAGYGFVSFKEPWDMTAAMREMNNKYIGSRPVKLKKSNWKERAVEEGAEPQWEYHKVKVVENSEHKKKKPRKAAKLPW